MTNKKQNVGDQTEVARVQDSLMQGHASFNNAMFKAVGGMECAAHAAVGGTAIGALGQGAFGSIAVDSRYGGIGSFFALFIRFATTCVHCCICWSIFDWSLIDLDQDLVL